MLSDAKVSKVMPVYSSQVSTGMPVYSSQVITCMLGIIAYFSSKALCPSICSIMCGTESRLHLQGLE